MIQHSKGIPQRKGFTKEAIREEIYRIQARKAAAVRYLTYKTLRWNRDPQGSVFVRGAQSPKLRNQTKTRTQRGYGRFHGV